MTAIMKISFFVFAVTCLINGLTAADLSAFNTNPNLENFGSGFLNAFEDNEDVKILPPSVLNDDEPSTPSDYSTSLRPTTSTTTRRPPPPPPPPRPSTTTTTRRPPPPPPPGPFPPPPPPPPRPFPPNNGPFPPPPPPPPRPFPPNNGPFPPPPRPIGNSQIYNNRAKSLGPFAGSLLNVVVNRGDLQATLQKNEVLYNIKKAS